MQPSLNPAPTRPTLFISCIKGLETLLVRELKALGISFAKAASSGVIIPQASLEEAMKICYGSRLALRVIWLVHAFRLWKPQNLYQQLVKQPWEQWLIHPEDPARLLSFKFAVTGQNHHFNNTHFVAQRAKDAVCDYFRDTLGKRPSVDRQQADVRFQIHLEEDQASLYYDLSGHALNQRGYRGETGEAPLNEVVAASLLALAGYDGFRPFCDPCCGSGTLLIEAGMIATKTPPGKLCKAWGFEKHPEFDPQTFHEIRQALDSAMVPLQENWLLGIDKDRNCVEQTQAILKRLNWSEVCLISKPFQYVELDRQYFMVTNPPFGRRLDGGSSSLKDLYHDLGAFFKKHASRAFTLSSEAELLDAMELPVLQSFQIDFGGLQCYLERFKLAEKRVKPTEETKL